MLKHFSFLQFTKFVHINPIPVLHKIILYKCVYLKHYWYIPIFQNITKLYHDHTFN